MPPFDSFWVRLVDYGGVHRVPSRDIRANRNPTLFQRHEFAIRAKLLGIAPLKVRCHFYNAYFMAKPDAWRGE